MAFQFQIPEGPTDAGNYRLQVLDQRVPPGDNLQRRIGRISQADIQHLGSDAITARIVYDKYVARAHPTVECDQLDLIRLTDGCRIGSIGAQVDFICSFPCRRQPVRGAKGAGIFL